MKEYLVTSDYGQWNNIFIVSANNAKDAIQQIYDNYITPMNKELREENKQVGYYMNAICKKSALHARSLGSLHNEYGKIIEVN